MLLTNGMCNGVDRIEGQECHLIVEVEKETTQNSSLHNRVTSSTPSDCSFPNGIQFRPFPDSSHWDLGSTKANELEDGVGGLRDTVMDR